MEVGKSNVVNMLFKMLNNNVKNDINNFVSNVCNSDFINIDSLDDINRFFGESISVCVDDLTEDDKMILRSWTSYNYRNINALLRRNWSYDVNGKLTDEKNLYYRKLADSLSMIIRKFNNPGINFIAYRGATLDSFSKYGVRTLLDFNNLLGNYIYEEGFASSSVLRDSSYFNINIGDGKEYNVEIRYLISSDFDDGIFLINGEMSYYVNENEFLIDKNTLSKVVDVKINGNNVILTVIPIPKKIWNFVPVNNLNGSRNR